MTAVVSSRVSLVDRILAFGLFVLLQIKAKCPRWNVPLVLLVSFVMLSIGLISTIDGLFALYPVENQRLVATIRHPANSNTYLKQSTNRIYQDIDKHLSGFQPDGDEEALSLLSLEDEVMSHQVSLFPDPAMDRVGRPDPFAPLLYKNDGSAFGDAEVEVNPFNAVQVIGIIQNRNKTNGRADGVTIVQINDDTQGALSLVKRVGDSFSLNDHLVTIKQIKPDGVTMAMDGKQQFVPLNTFVDHVKTKKVDETPLEETDDLESKNTGTGSKKSKKDTLDALEEVGR